MATLSIPELAVLLRCSHTAIHDRLKANTGPKTKGQGRQTRITLEDAQIWLEAELRALQRRKQRVYPLRIRIYQDAIRYCRVERAFERIQLASRYRRRRSPATDWGTAQEAAAP